MRPIARWKMGVFVVGLSVVATPGRADAQVSSIDLTVNDIGLSVGDSPRTIGLRFNYLDRQMIEVRGANATVWGTARVGQVTGLALGVPVTGARQVRGVGIGAVGVRAATSLRGVMLGGGWLEAGSMSPESEALGDRQGIDGVAIAPVMIVRRGRLRGVAVGGTITTETRNRLATYETGIDGVTLSGLWTSTPGALRGITASAGLAHGESVRWATFAGASIRGRREVEGLSAAGLAITGGRLSGVSVAGGTIVSRETLSGLAVTGGYLSSGARIRGISVGGFGVGAKDEIVGITAGGFSVSAPHLRGLSAAGFRLSGSDLTGLAIGGGFVNASGSLTGLTAAPIVIADRLSGVGMGALMGGQNLTGAFVAPIGLSVNREGTLRGASLGAVNAIHGTQRGLTIGIINSARVLHGVQVGLVNFAANNPSGRRVLPLVNWQRD